MNTLEEGVGLFEISFSIVKYKYSSSVSTCAAQLKVLLTVLNASVILTAPKERLSEGSMLCRRGFHHLAKKNPKKNSEMFTNSEGVAAATGSDQHSGLEVG